MKILIADDQARRYDKLVSELQGMGVSREDLIIVPSANEARAILADQQFDLLVLDVLLPLWPEEEASPTHSIDLLVELHQTEALKRPRRIVGLTGDIKLVQGAREEFETWTWSVVQYSESNTEWMARILNCVRYIQQEKSHPPNVYGVDLAIICALAAPELEEVLKLPWNWSPPRPLDDVTFVSDGYVDVDSRRITVAATHAPRMGMVATALKSASIINLLRPRLLAMCGICAGVEKKVNLGDVILADPAWDFQSGKRVRDKENAKFSIAPHHLYPDSIIRSHVEQLKADIPALGNIAVQYPTGDASGFTRIAIGPLASGSAVLADGQVISEIKQQHRELVGIEMEGYGLYAAAHSASLPQPRAFVLKGVCDFADPDKDDKHQRYAAYASARVLQLLIERYGPRLLV